jgi:hypothetical protein
MVLHYFPCTVLILLPLCEKTPKHLFINDLKIVTNEQYINEITISI